MDERAKLETRIKKLYVDSQEFSFKDLEEAESFVKNAAYYVEQAFQDEGHFRYKTLMDFSCDWKADAIIQGVATHDYNWFL